MSRKHPGVQVPEIKKDEKSKEAELNSQDLQMECTDVNDSERNGMIDHDIVNDFANKDLEAAGPQTLITFRM